MNPFFFGRSSRQLFGAYDRPETTMRDEGIVICPPLGDEYLFGHPTTRYLARELAASGFHVLRFDYSGTGDSAGEFEDSSVAVWLDDIETAIAEVKDLGLVSRVSLIGLRFGGALAARIAHGRDDGDHLVLWDSPVDGRHYLEEIGAASVPESETIDARGMLLPPSLRQSIANLTVESFASPLPRTLIMASERSVPSAEVLYDRLMADGVDCTFDRVTEEEPWRERRLGAGALTIAAVKGIVAWLA